MLRILLALMIYLAPNANRAQLELVASALSEATCDPVFLAELFTIGRYESLWGTTGLLFGVTEWRRAHGGRQPTIDEALGAAMDSLRTADRVCARVSPASRTLSLRLGAYGTGVCRENPYAVAEARSVQALLPVFRSALAVEPRCMQAPIFSLSETNERSYDDP